MVKLAGGILAGWQNEKIVKKCTFKARCPFFNDQLPRKRSTQEREALKKKFCGGGSSQCARFMVAAVLGLDSVPGNLFPDHFYRVSTLLGLP
jgi:hypothetical protein